MSKEPQASGALMDKFYCSQLKIVKFLAEKPKEVDAYIKSMLEKKVKPPEYTGTHWRAGYTCRDLLRYNWTQYRNCRYYHRYHGRYYY